MQNNTLKQTLVPIPEESVATQDIAEPLSAHTTLMDCIYRYQKNIYDVTRKFFLFGRDRLIDEVVSHSPGTILEVGSGTGRNLLKLRKKLSTSQLFGFDASQEMLKYSEERIASEGATSSIHVSYGLAETFDAKTTFKINSGFDVVFLSYSLSMIPNWREALENSFSQVAPGGHLLIVDFWDQHTYSKIFQILLKKWLSFFHVHFNPAHLAYLTTLAERTKSSLKIRPIGSSYAYLAIIKSPR